MSTKTAPSDLLLADYAALARSERLLPVLVSPLYQRLVREEMEVLGGPIGPLYKVVYPTEDRLHSRAPGEVPDFVKDRSNMPPDSGLPVIRKYRNRALVLTTERCASHCMYCFRQDLLAEEDDRNAHNVAQLAGQLTTYLAERPEISEVILSGGDPLTLPDRALTLLLTEIATVGTVRHIRVHTRNPVFAPQTVSEKKIQALAQVRARVVIHVVHPYELHDEARAAIHRLRSAGVRCYSQFPVLRGINDHPLVLGSLLEDLDDLGVRPLSMFIADPISYSATFRIPLRRLFEVVDNLNLQTSSWINSVRLVMDTPIGKVRRDNISSWDREAGVVYFERGGEKVEYIDFPESLDIPGDPEIMLWRQPQRELPAPPGQSDRDGVLTD